MGCRASGDDVNGVDIGEIAGYQVVVGGSSDRNVYMWDAYGRLIWIGTEPLREVYGVTWVL